jgi:signal transduction histidine kinase
MDLAQFEAARKYVGFDAAAVQALAAFLPLAAPTFGEIVDDFYDAILRHPRSRAALTGGGVQVARLKKTLVGWLATGLEGPHDQGYLDARRRIGEVHVNIRLPQELMFTAMNRVRRGLLARARETLSGSALQQTADALEQWLDLELALMLDSYAEHWATRVRAGERLATIGQFAAAIGHELRNPLSVVESSTSLVAQRLEQLGVHDAVVEKHHQRISRQIKNCGDTIHGLLELARESPPKKVLQPLLELVEATVEALAAPDRITVSVRIATNTKVFADPFQLREVFANLFRNAVAALVSGGTITIHATELENGVEVWVEDDGPGVPEAIRERVFELWFSSQSNGTGLGLALARKLCEAHGGTLTLEPSERGARFRLWIPRAGSHLSNA